MITRVSERIRQAEKAINPDNYFTDNPLNFQFYYKKNETVDINNTVYLEDGEPPLNLYLEVFNESSNSIKFQSVTDSRQSGRLPLVNIDDPNSASETRSHFYLVWEKDLGLKLSDIEIEETNDWLVNYDETDYSLFMYFLRKTTHNLLPKDSRNKFDRIKVTFKKITANNRIIKSSNVDFYYGGESGLVLVKKNNNQEEPLTEQQNRSKTVYVTNDPQKLNIPLQFRFLGSDCILNDGSTQNTLNLKIINSPPSSNTRPILPLTKNSKITISFKKGDSAEALLVTDDQLKILNIEETTTSPTSTLNWTPTHEQNSTKWEFTAKTARQIGAEGEVINISIKNLVTTSASGLGYLYIDYQNIGSYPDGRLVVAIEKTPLLYKDHNVGIGTTDAKIQLAIGDHDTGLQQQGDGNLAIYTDYSERVRIGKNGNVGIGTTDPKIHLAIKDNNTGLQQQGDGNLAIYTDNKERVRIETNGKVGIGTTSPEKELHVVGDLALGKDENNKKFLFHSRKDNDGDYLQITYDKADGTLEASEGITLRRGGKVGIGTTYDFPAKFEIEAIGGEHYPRDFICFYNPGEVLNQQSRIVWCNGSDRSYAAAIISQPTTKPGMENNHGNLRFQTSSKGILSDKMLIQADGKVGIGTTTPSAKLDVSGDAVITGNVGIGTTTPSDKLDVSGSVLITNNIGIGGDLRMTNSNNTFKIAVERDKVTFHISNSTIGGINSNRFISWDGDLNWDGSSDLRLKTDIDPEKNILNRLMGLEVKNYRWKDEPEKLTKNIGFVAQDVKPWFPSLVGEAKNPQNDETTLTLKSGAFGILAVGGLKELKLEKDAEIAELKALLNDEIAELKAQIQQLKS